jgi:PD-(D/E)XK nuclease superfamily
MRLSHSAVETLKQCSLKYKLHYVDRMRSKRMSSALAFGVCFDEALNELLLNKDLNKSISVFKEKWLPFADNEYVDYYKSDLVMELIHDWVPESLYNWYSMYRKGVGMLASYEANILPRIKAVKGLQERIALHGYDDRGNETEDSITGIIDFIADVEMDDGVVVTAIIDNKSASKLYPKNAVLTKEQTALYSMAHADIEYAAFAVVCKAPPFKTQLLIGKPPEELKDRVIDNFVTACHTINEADFIPNRKACWSFGMACPYLSYCNGKGFSKDIYKAEEK